MKKENVILIVCFAMCAILLSRLDDYTVRRKYEQFNSLNLRGIIVKIERSKLPFVIMNSSKEKHEIFSQTNKKGDFLSTSMSIGDSLIKPPFSDSIILIDKETHTQNVFPCMPPWEVE